MNIFERASERESKRLDLAEIDTADELQSHVTLIVSLFGSLASGEPGDTAITATLATFWLHKIIPTTWICRSAETLGVSWEGSV